MAGVDMDLVARLERSMLTSWPALSTAFDQDWVIRLANGVTKRSNSITCLGSDAADLEARIDRAAAVFERRNLPPTFRLSPLAPPALTEALDRRGWRRFDESIVMTVDLADLAADDPAHDFRISMTADADWLEACGRIGELSETDLATLATMLGNLLPAAGYGRLHAGDRIAALALTVIDLELAGLFEVMTARDHRRQGLSRALLSHLLRFGKQQGAKTGWLAVAAYNQPAVALYQSLGFSEVYRYHYREPDPT